MSVPILDLKRQYQALKAEIDDSLRRVTSIGFFTLGREVEAFEREFSSYIGTKFAVGLASGTDALTLSLRAIDLDGDSEVLLPANSYPTVFGVALAGVRIRLVDCDTSGLMDVAALEKAVTKHTKVIIPVHLYGAPVDVFSIHRLIENKEGGIRIIEDAAQAHGALLGQESGGKVDWKKSGSIGDIGCFSFYPSKNLGAYGDGGMIVTNNEAIAKRVRRLRMYGEESRYYSIEVSGVSRLDELQAAILRVKLEHLDEWNRRRTIIVQYYIKELEGLDDIGFVSRRAGKPAGEKSCHHLFVIRTEKRDALKQFLRDNGIGCAIHYPSPIHLTESFRYLGYKKGNFPEAESLSREALSLPLFPELTDDEVETVISTIRKFFRK